MVPKIKEQLKLLAAEKNQTDDTSLITNAI